MFYQNVTIRLFEALIKQQCPIATDPFVTPNVVNKMTYEEENAVRYIGGYMLRTLSTKAEREDDKMLLEAINDLKGDVNELPTATEEWTGSVDRGGLWYVTYAAHQFFCSTEYSLRQYLHVTNAHLMDNTFRSKLTKMVTEDDDVQFSWTIAAAASSMEGDIVDLAFEAILNLYITIRGFSFATSILEMYKQEAKKGTQKRNH